MALAFTGCSDDGDSDTSKADASGSPSATGDRVAPANLADVPKLQQGKGAVADVVVAECAVGAGEQAASGTLTSSRKQVRDYVVVISWVNDHSDVRGRAVAVEKGVKPGETRDWRASAEVATGATACVRNVRAGRLSR